MMPIIRNEENSFFVLIPEAFITRVSLHLDASPTVIRMENRDANGRAYRMTLGVCRRRYWITTMTGGFFE
jgi:hypothetical protein